jgi:hypothetical protein
MNHIPQIAWLTLSSVYYVSPDAPVDSLLDDATILLENAHAITRLITKSLKETGAPDFENIGQALGGVAVLIDMALSCTKHAQLQTLRVARQTERKM